MQVRDAMSDDVQIASPNQSIREAAILMAKIDVGVLPVGDNDRLVGMITDRDIAVRAIALGKGPDTKVRDVMSEEVKYCFEEDDVDEVAQNMADIKVRRLPVLNKRQAPGRHRLAGRSRHSGRPRECRRSALQHIRAGRRAFAVRPRRGAGTLVVLVARRQSARPGCLQRRGAGNRL